MNYPINELLISCQISMVDMATVIHQVTLPIIPIFTWSVLNSPGKITYFYLTYTCSGPYGEYQE